MLTIADIRLARYGEAEDILMAAIRAGDDARLRVWLGQVYLSAGRKQEALEQALRALTLEPSLPEALSLRDAASR